MSEVSKATKAADALLASAVIPEERELADALVEITKKYGKFNEDDTGVWAGYTPASENENADKGVKCANCILYQGGTECAILATQVEPEGSCRFALIPDGVVTAAGSRPAPRKDRIHGSRKNKPGSADGTKKIVFSKTVETALRNKVKEHNEKASADRQATLPMLKAVYRRGAGAFSSSHRPGKTRDQWAMARVNAYLRLLRSGQPANSNYKQDNDLLPRKHPRSTRGEMAITASAAALEELTVQILPEEEYDSPEHVIIACAEYSGLGYETIPAFRATWLRAVRDLEDPYQRVKDLATLTYRSDDADLLPKALTAGLPPGDAWRSIKAKMQRRDRKGRFAEMGGGFSFSLKLRNGNVSRVSGKIVGMSGEEDVDVDVRGHKDLADGVYSVPSSKGDATKAVLKLDAVKDLDMSKVKQADAADAIDISELKKTAKPSEQIVKDQSREEKRWRNNIGPEDLPTEDDKFWADWAKTWDRMQKDDMQPLRRGGSDSGGGDNPPPAPPASPSDEPSRGMSPEKAFEKLKEKYGDKLGDLTPKQMETVNNIGSPEDLDAIGKQLGLPERSVADIFADFEDLRNGVDLEERDRQAEADRQNRLKSLDKRAEQAAKDKFDASIGALEDHNKEAAAREDKGAIDNQFDRLSRSGEFKSFAEGMMRQGLSKEEVINAWYEQGIDADLLAENPSAVRIGLADYGDTSASDSELGRTIKDVLYGANDMSKEQRADAFRRIAEADTTRTAASRILLTATDIAREDDARKRNKKADKSPKG